MESSFLSNCLFEQGKKWRDHNMVRVKMQNLNNVSQYRTGLLCEYTPGSHNQNHYYLFFPGYLLQFYEFYWIIACTLRDWRVNDNVGALVGI